MRENRLPLLLPARRWRLWSNHDFETARGGLAADVKVTVTSTNPNLPNTNTGGIDDYVSDLEQFGQIVAPGARPVGGLPARPGVVHNIDEALPHQATSRGVRGPITT